MIERLATAGPWFGVTSVSTRAAEIWLMARSSSSAAICSIPVVVPWPSSTLPMNTVAVLSACTAIHESRSSGSGVAAAAGVANESSNGFVRGPQC